MLHTASGEVDNAQLLVARLAFGEHEVATKDLNAFELDVDAVRDHVPPVGGVGLIDRCFNEAAVHRVVVGHDQQSRCPSGSDVARIVFDAVLDARPAARHEAKLAGRIVRVE
jgi:hypothetical protein